MSESALVAFGARAGQRLRSFCSLGQERAGSRSAISRFPERSAKGVDTASPYQERGHDHSLTQPREKKAPTAHSVDGWHLNHPAPPEAGAPPDSILGFSCLLLVLSGRRCGLLLGGRLCGLLLGCCARARSSAGCARGNSGSRPPHLALLLCRFLLTSLPLRPRSPHCSPLPSEQTEIHAVLAEKKSTCQIPDNRIHLCRAPSRSVLLHGAAERTRAELPFTTERRLVLQVHQRHHKITAIARAIARRLRRRGKGHGPHFFRV